MKIKGKNPILVAITGNLCSGKSFVLKAIEEIGYPVFSFDKETDALLSSDESVKKNIKKYFPEAISNEKVNKAKLGDIVFFNKNFLKILEEILRPKLYANRDNFIKKLGKKRIAFFEVPLLFEKGREAMYDYIILLTISKEVQIKRIKERNIPEEKAKKIMSFQLLPEDIKFKSDYIIDTNIDLANIKRIIKKIISQLESEF